jgi:glutamate-1-semialdehyde 2,1-aminomutase
VTHDIDRTRLRDLMRRELDRFEQDHPRSRELFEVAEANLLAGVPMPWMSEWAGPYPVFVAEAHGARFTDVDGREYVDLCLGDTGSMTGHGPKEAVDAIAEQAAKGITSCCRPRTRRGWAPSCSAASACPSGSSV